MSPLNGKKIILGVCGSIAAYKAAYLLRELQKRGADVRVVMTPSAANFIAPLTFSSLSHNQVYLDMFPEAGHATSTGTWHIELGVWADCMLIAPITASTIAKLTYGIADNFLTSLALALRGSLVIAPAMDTDMFVHPATGANLARLKERGVHVVEPEEGDLASGLVGPGRLAEVSTVVARLESILDGARMDFGGRRVLVTAGPTQEPIDAVRYISNRSSGRMGYAIAAAAANRGAEVRLVSGPVALEAPRNVKRESVATAEEMREAVARNVDWCEVLIMAAAVADYKVANPPDRKIKKTEFFADPARLELVATTDILMSVAALKGSRVYVGFALETDTPLENGRVKLESKGLDMVVINNPREEGAGFATETNRVSILTHRSKHVKELPLMQKYDVGMRILDEVKLLLSVRQGK